MFQSLSQWSNLDLFMREKSGEVDAWNILTGNIDESQAAFDEHFNTVHFQAVGKRIEEEKLLAAPLDIKTIKPFAGFASR